LYLRQGRYYRAAESFTLAAAYQPNDGRAFLGKSYALFGAGEYLSSALYLARALELDPRAVLGRSDLVNAIGGPVVFAARITDLEQCAGTGDAPQLQFLLAYVYSQMNRPVEAQAALAAAEKQLSPSLALDLLKTIVGRP
jgi:tetratricopeptide (TPR) repeat protein